MIMTNMMFVVTLILNFVAALFAIVYIIVNFFKDSFSDLEDRSEDALKISRVAMIVSFVLALFTCLMSNYSDVAFAISQSATLYSVIFITWLAIALGNGLFLLFTVISKKHYKPSFSKATKKLFKITIPGAIVGLVLTWLFS